MITTTEAGTWVDAGTRSLLAGLDQLSDTDLDHPCALPGWTRRELQSRPTPRPSDGC